MTDAELEAQIRVRDAEEARFDAAMGTMPSMLELDRRTLLRLLDEARGRITDLVAESRAANEEAAAIRAAERVNYRAGNAAQIQIATLRKERDEARADYERLATKLNDKAKAEKEHCKDCCCARSWKALGITEYTGKSIPEHIADIDARLAKADAEIERLRKTMRHALLWHNDCLCRALRTDIEAALSPPPSETP